MSEEKTAKPKWNEKALNKGECIALKRSAGLMMDQASDKAVAAYYRVRNPENVSAYKDEIQFACLSMSCMWDNGMAKVPLQALLGKLCKESRVKGPVRKACLECLDNPWRRDGFLLKKIYSLVVMVKKEIPGVMPDFERLADDLIRWNYDKRFIQRNWINQIFN